LKSAICERHIRALSRLAIIECPSIKAFQHSRDTRVLFTLIFYITHSIHCRTKDTLDLSAACSPLHCKFDSKFVARRSSHAFRKPSARLAAKEKPLCPSLFLACDPSELREVSRHLARGASVHLTIKVESRARISRERLGVFFRIFLIRETVYSRMHVRGTRERAPDISARETQGGNLDIGYRGYASLRNCHHPRVHARHVSTQLRNPARTRFARSRAEIPEICSGRDQFDIDVWHSCAEVNTRHTITRIFRERVRCYLL